MSSETEDRLPVIDFSKQELKPGSPEWGSVEVQVREALEEYGGFEVLFDKVAEIREEVFGAMEELFDLPSPTKQLFISNKPFLGYHDATAKLLRESMMIDEAHVAGNIDQGLTKILWPQGNISLSKTIESFTQLAAGLEKTIRRMVLENFGIEKYKDELIDNTNYDLRDTKYGRPQTGTEPTLGADAHNDKDFMTLLHQNEVNGLEIRTKDGEWINIKPSPNYFVVIIGESLSVWLNGRLSAPYHRVTTKGNKVRYSIAVFANPRGVYPVKVPEELVADKNGLLFKTFDFEEYLGYYAAQAARGDFIDLKVYCNI
ncbi:gibberellin 3-beta-dioxygenase 1-like [Hibiscus syriacus]|uniref:Gibberellin 3-beta-dioxygenase 1-like n=1 Tax=Hibiscus syriacus TaxID=106335 RepID=A0A6A2YK22_HIBSY|nr:probable 2-oxoglutarate-dependent dioxygenase AOP1 [Hibiscus syriacus]KAE8678147.1 gibberellin 3-beta-dioxygenase 1-like [Hibiscus syriacus]